MFLFERMEFSWWFSEFMADDKKPEKEAPHYFCLELTKVEVGLLKAGLEKLSPTKGVRTLVEKVDLARRVDLPLGDVVDWDALEAKARARGSSIADLFWDNPKGDGA